MPTETVPARKRELDELSNSTVDEVREINGIRLGEFVVDLFMTEDNSLGIAVSPYASNDSTLDIFVYKDLSVVFG
jgi:hypothetical protein